MAPGVAPLPAYPQHQSMHQSQLTGYPAHQSQLTGYPAHQPQPMSHQAYPYQQQQRPSHHHTTGWHSQSGQGVLNVASASVPLSRLHDARSPHDARRPDLPMPHDASYPWPTSPAGAPAANVHGSHTKRDVGQADFKLTPSAPKRIAGSDLGKFAVAVRSPNDVTHAQKTAEVLEAAPLGFPAGPIADDCLVDTIVSYASNVDTGGGGHGVKRPNGIRPPTSKSGSKCTYVCASRKGCDWHATYELTQGGWFLVGGSFEHTGEPHLEKSRAAVMVQPTARHIPNELAAIATVMARANVKISTIQHVLDTEANFRGLPISWTYDDLRNAFAVSARDRDLDASNFLEALERRRKDGLRFFARVDNENRLISCFVECAGAFAEWARAGSMNVVLFDPTHSTNKYRLKLAPFTTVSPSGQTVMLAFILHVSEDAATFEWGFRCFAETFNVPPNAVFTDRDQAIASALLALSDVWPETRVFWCVYHLSQNLYTHIHPLFAGNNDGWRGVHDAWWRIAKETDTESVATFDTEFDALVTLLRNTGKGPTLEQQIEWLDVMRRNASKWAARYVWSTCTYGIHSTQRAESMQASIKTVLTANSLLVDVLAEVERHNEHSRARRDMQDVRLSVRIHNEESVLPPWLTALKHDLTPYALRLVIEQFRETYHYDVTPPADPRRGAWLVQRREESALTGDRIPRYDENGMIIGYECDMDFGFGKKDRVRSVTGYLCPEGCSCQFPTAFGGLPCRHILKVFLLRDLKKFPIDGVSPKWLLLNDAQLARNTTQLRRTALARRMDDDEESVPACTSDARAAQVMDAARRLADASAASGTAYDVVIREMEAISLHLAEDGNGASAALPSARSEASAPSEGSLEAVLGVLLRAAEDAPDVDLILEEPRQLLGQRVAIYKHRKGGWILATVASVLSPGEDTLIGSGKDRKPYPCNYELETKNGKVKHALVQELYFGDIKGRAYNDNWILLETKPLDAGLGHDDVLLPPHERKLGKPSSKRLAPSHGPMSRNYSATARP